MNAQVGKAPALELSITHPVFMHSVYLRKMDAISVPYSLLV
jgi:hypothetical protein